MPSLAATLYEKSQQILEILTRFRKHLNEAKARARDDNKTAQIHNNLFVFGLYINEV
jgi:hypothetical protein